MASINSLQDMGWPVSARTLAAASSALSFLLSAPASLVFLDLVFLGLFDAAMTRLPNFGFANKRQRGHRAARQGRISTRVRPEIQTIPAEVSQMSTSSFPAQESPDFPQAGLEAGAFPRLIVIGGLVDSYGKGGTYARERQ